MEEEAAKMVEKAHAELAVAIDVVSVYAFRLLQEEEHYNLALLEEHRLAEEQLEGVSTSDFAVTANVEADPDVVDDNRPVLASMESACSLRCERWQLRVNEVEHARHFERLEARDDYGPEQHDDDAKEASVSSALFAPATNNDKAKPFGAGKE